MCLRCFVRGRVRRQPCNVALDSHISQAHPRSDITSHASLARTCVREKTCVRSYCVSGQSALCFLKHEDTECSSSLDPSIAASQQQPRNDASGLRIDKAAVSPCRIYSGYGPLCDHTCRTPISPSSCPAPKMTSVLHDRLAPPACGCHISLSHMCCLLV